MHFYMNSLIKVKINQTRQITQSTQLFVFMGIILPLIFLFDIWHFLCLKMWLLS